MSYPASSLTIKDLIRNSFSHYGKSFKASLLFILLAVVMQDLYLYVGYGSSSPLVYLLTFIVITTAALFFWSAAIVAADRQIKNTPSSLGCSLVITLKKIVNVISIAGFYAILFLASSFWMHFLMSFGAAHKLSPNMQSLLNLGLAGAPLLVTFLGMLFAIPRILTSNDGLMSSIKYSFIVGWQHRFKLALAVYFGMMILAYVVIPSTRHAAWLAAHHVKMLVDAVSLMILAPLVINFILLALNNPAPVPQVRSRKAAAK